MPLSICPYVFAIADFVFDTLVYGVIVDSHPAQNFAYLLHWNLFKIVVNIQ